MTYNPLAKTAKGRGTAIHRRAFLTAAAAASAVMASVPLVEVSGGDHRTHVSIQADRFLINGRPTYSGRTFRGFKVEGLLMNSRMANGIFDDLNPETRHLWKYLDTGEWDPERNTREFVAAMPAWRQHGLLSFTVNLQGGNPKGYTHEQPWHNSAFYEDGTPRQDYFLRLQKILDAADRLGMAPVLGCFYFGQDQTLRDEAAVVHALEQVVSWVLEKGYRNVLLEINNECNVRYHHAVLFPDRVHELIVRAQKLSSPGNRLLAGTSFGGGAIPTENVVAASDFVLLHGNRVDQPAGISSMVNNVRQIPGYRPKPILFNEDDHFNFNQPSNNMMAALGAYASWGLLDIGENNYRDGYQSPPVNWAINTERKQAFFDFLQEMTRPG